jgi:glycine/D-amino acid oxidase-like deaminating enzyme
LPFNPVKGEVLRVKFKEEISLKEMVNQGVFVIPLPNGRARVGATYSWHDLDWIPTEKGRADLLEKYNKLMLADIEVEDNSQGYVLLPKTVVLSLGYIHYILIWGI